MPLYDYDCASCGQRFEILSGVHTAPPDACPLCGGGPVKKAIAAPAVHFKGTGWAKKERHAASGSRTRGGTGESTDGSGGSSDGSGPSDGSGSSDSSGSSPDKSSETRPSGSGSKDDAKPTTAKAGSAPTTTATTTKADPT